MWDPNNSNGGMSGSWGWPMGGFGYPSFGWGGKFGGGNPFGGGGSYPGGKFGSGQQPWGQRQPRYGGGGMKPIQPGGQAFPQSDYVMDWQGNYVPNTGQVY